MEFPRISRMPKITATEFASPFARTRREHEDVILAVKAAFVSESDSVATELASIEADWEKLRAAWKAKRLCDKTFVKRAKLLEARVKANATRRVTADKHREELVSAQGKLIATYAAERDDRFNKLRGLTAYLVGSGRSTAAVSYLHNILLDYRNSPDQSEKHGLADQVYSILDADEFQNEEPESRVLRDLDAISDPEAKTAFYKAHRSEIHESFNQQQLKDLDENSNNP